MRRIRTKPSSMGMPRSEMMTWGRKARRMSIATATLPAFFASAPYCLIVAVWSDRRSQSSSTISTRKPRRSRGFMQFIIFVLTTSSDRWRNRQQPGSPGSIFRASPAGRRRSAGAGDLGPQKAAGQLGSRPGSIALELVMQRFQTDAEKICCAGLVVVGVLQCFQDQVLLGLCHGYAHLQRDRVAVAPQFL